MQRNQYLTCRSSSLTRLVGTRRSLRFTKEGVIANEEDNI